MFSVEEEKAGRVEVREAGKALLNAPSLDSAKTSSDDQPARAAMFTE